MHLPPPTPVPPSPQQPWNLFRPSPSKSPAFCVPKTGFPPVPLGKDPSMDRAPADTAPVQTRQDHRSVPPTQPTLFSSDSVLDILKLIFTGAPLQQILTIIAKLVESRADGLLCTIWLP